MLKSKYDDGRKHHCSQKCLIKGRSPSRPKQPRIQLACKHCGQPFYLLKCQTKGSRGQFCSRPCVAAYTIRHLATGPSSIEKLLIDELNKRKIPFEFQHPVTGWTIDFAIPALLLAVEADGVYWHSLPNVQEKDKRKDADLQARGWTVLHFTGDEIRDSVSDCVDQIEQVITSLS
jgi:very-short-patch-repair endonuclease